MLGTRGVAQRPRPVGRPAFYYASCGTPRICNGGIRKEAVLCAPTSADAAPDFSHGQADCVGPAGWPGLQATSQRNFLAILFSGTEQDWASRFQAPAHAVSCRLRSKGYTHRRTPTRAQTYAGTSQHTYIYTCTHTPTHTQTRTHMCIYYIHTQRWTNRQMDRCTDGQTDKQTSKQTIRPTCSHIDR